MKKAEKSSWPQPQSFRLMVTGQAITVFGTSLLRFALSLYVLDITGRADLFAALLAVSSVPILLAPLGGAISDRYSRKILMVLYDTGCCIVTFAFLFILASGGASVFVVGVVMIILGIVGAMETPNVSACIPQLVTKEQLQSANGMVQAVQSLSGIAAPIIGGILYGAWDLRILVTISGMAFALAAIMEACIKIPFMKRVRTGGMVRTIAADLKDGFAYVWKDSFNRKLTVMAALLNLALVPCFIVAAPLVLRVTLNSGDTLYGIGMGAVEAAMILGALLVGVFSKKMRVNTIWRWVLGIALLFVPLSLSLIPFVIDMGFWPPFFVFTLCIMLMAAATTILSIFVIVKIQVKTPNEHLGKVMAIIQAVAQCAAPIGQLIYGIMFERFASAVYIPLLLAGIFTAGIAFMSKATLKKEDVINDANHSNA
ncbi:MAG: MFS transporter [Gracilibacteraceae bacterium]|jgi:MFS family permease|nr:MFS transporter [Gracilibacteraceae bacterium]